MGTSYVDNTLHAAANATGTATGGGTDYILLADAGTQADGEFNGYGILITAGTGAGQQRRIVGYDHSGHADGERCATVNSAWAVAPDATSTYEITVGSDVNSGADRSPGATGPWRTIDAAMNAVAGMGSGAQWVHIKGGRCYEETATIDTARSFGQSVAFEGYVSEPGDGGRATIDGGGVRSAGLATSIGAAVYYAFRNVSVVGCTSNGFDLTGVSMIRFVDCASRDNGASGFSAGQDSILIDCEASGNGGNGFFCSSATTSLGSLLIGCRAHGNANNQFRCGSMVLMFCTAGGLADNKPAVYAQIPADALHLINCTIDGTGSTGATGLQVSASARHIVVNTIFSNLARGVYSSTMDHLRLARHNLFFNCSESMVTNFPTDGGDVAVDPSFVDADAGDLRLLVESAALRAGFPAFVDIGSSQHASRCMIGGPCGRGMQF